MHRPTSDGSAVGGLAHTDPAAWAEWPAIRSFLLERRYAESEVEREPGVIVVSSDPLRWTWILKDPTAATQLRVSGATWDELIILSEGLLSDKRAPWVPDPYAAAKRRPGRR